MVRKLACIHVRACLLALLALSSMFPTSAQAQGPIYSIQWGTPGGGNGQLLDPRGIAVDANGNVYVADSNNHRIQEFTNSGAYIRQWGTLGSGAGQFNYPYGVAVDAVGDVYVADRLNDRVQKFTGNGIYITQWGSHGTGNGMFDQPYGVATDASGNVYVVDDANNRIEKFTSDGTYVTQWGGFTAPLGVAVDASGGVFVTDEAGHVQKFTAAGTFVTLWAAGSLPYGVAVDASGTVFVADYGGHRIRDFTSDGTLIALWGSGGTGDGQFTEPAGLAVDGIGDVFVADSGNGRIQVFAFNGILVVTNTIGRGIVTRSPNGLRYYLGTAVTLTAVPLPGARFIGWSGDATTVQDTLAITVEHPLNYVAAFGGDPAAAPHLVAVGDVPADQGSFVKVDWQSSPIDTGAVPGVLCCYEIQRQPSSPAAPWEAIASVPAVSLPSYSLDVSTPLDSTLVDPAVSRYRVVARARGDTAQWVSNEASGYSVDNLAPPAPASVGGSIASGFASLSWPAVTAPADFAGYHVFRGPEESMALDAAHLVGTTTATSFNDSPGYFAHYRVTAFDVHGNDSPGTLFVPFNPADVPGGPAPKVLSIGNPSPSPMARSMSMTLGLPRAMSTTVDVLDSQGRLVRRLCEGEKPAGWFTLSWDARDAGGHESAAGMYFLRVQTPQGRSVKRLVLIP